LAPLGGGYDSLVDWNVVKRSFSYDHLIDWNRLDYRGKTCKFIDVGISPPDQFSLGKAKEIIDKFNHNPYSLFFIGLNSHYPFDSPLNIEENWRKIESINFQITGKDKTNLLDKYKKSINYQLHVWADYISKNGSPDDVYIIFGDHQPPFITDDNYGKDTPIHIITQKEEIISDLQSLGFNNRIEPENKEAVINHEGFYSIFMSLLNKHFGSDKTLELNHLKNGINLN
jgi:phosphoglycerol transferase MdoB-like AlkP superfamily enzyme